MALQRPLQARQAVEAESFRGPDHAGITGAGGAAELLGGRESRLLGMGGQVFGDPSFGRGERAEPGRDPLLQRGRLGLRNSHDRSFASQ